MSAISLTSWVRAGSLLAVWAVVAAEPEFDPAELVRFPPVAPDRALATFQVRPGCRLELVAAEPLVVDPIGLCFDENGRMFVIEMVGYSERRPEMLGRIRMLEDTDGDGRFDRSTVYARGLPWPTALFWYDGGLFVGATPDLFYFKDTDGDDVADRREVVFTGFASDYAPYRTNQLNMQAMLNNLTWGLDNRIHGATSFNGGHVRCVKTGQTNALNLRGRDFSFDPRRLDLRAESGGGQHGLTFDTRGRKFICSNSDHLQLLMYEDRYAASNPFLALPAPRVSIAVDGPAATVYRISPDEPWRVIRTRWRVAGLVPGPIEGGGTPSGYFTSATGLIVYRGDAWPEAAGHEVFIADCGSNLIHRKQLHPDGVLLKGARPPDEQKSEFLASSDTWFRPVQLANGPDGALYVIDMYREIIEHPWSLPQPLKSHLDLNAGNDRGRIYRVVPEGYKQRPLPRLGKASLETLVATLSHPNGWHRDTAARLLYERQDRRAGPLLTKLLATGTNALGRVRALYALHSLGLLEPRHLRVGLRDPAPVVRQHAVRLCEEPASGALDDPELRRALLERAEDPDIWVRYQLAWTLGRVRVADKLAALERILRRDAAEPWMRWAVLSASADVGERLFFRLAKASDFRGRPGGLEFVRQLAEVLGAQARRETVGSVLAFLRNETRADDALLLPVASGLAAGLERRGRSLAGMAAAADLAPVLARAAKLAADAAQSERRREQAVRLLSAGTWAGQGKQLLGLLGSEAPASLQKAAVSVLARFPEPAVAGRLIETWDRLTPQLRGEVLGVLLKRADRIPALLDAVEAGRVLPIDLDTGRKDFLRRHSNAAIRARANTLLGEAGRQGRQAVVEKFRPALKLTGVATNGHRIFLERCISCHRLGGEGYALGPDLAVVRNTGKEKLLVSILDPNRTVAANYVNYEIETTDDESVFGIIVAENDTSVTLRRAYGSESTVLRRDIRSIRSQGLSAMPEELEAGLNEQEFADLLEFISTVGP